MANVSFKIRCEKSFVDLQLECLQEDPKYKYAVCKLLDVLVRMVKNNVGKDKTAA